ncbi:MAG: LapA family protein [Pseudomonadota bacterium]
MQIVRTIIWVLIAAALVLFSVFNWKSAEVTIWDGIIWETRLPAVVIIAFLMGLVPMWLYHRGSKWSLNRRIRSLENSIKSNALARRHEPADKAPVGSAVEKPVQSPANAGDTLTPASPATNPQRIS